MREMVTCVACALQRDRLEILRQIRLSHTTKYAASDEWVEDCSWAVLSAGGVEDCVGAREEVRHGRRMRCADVTLVVVRVYDGSGVTQKRGQSGVWREVVLLLHPMSSDVCWNDVHMRHALLHRPALSMSVDRPMCPWGWKVRTSCLSGVGPWASRR